MKVDILKELIFFISLFSTLFKYYSQYTYNKQYCNKDKL